jgi:hypothetical protein
MRRVWCLPGASATDDIVSYISMMAFPTHLFTHYPHKPFTAGFRTLILTAGTVSISKLRPERVTTLLPRPAINLSPHISRHNS